MQKQSQAHFSSMQWQHQSISTNWNTGAAGWPSPYVKVTEAQQRLCRETEGFSYSKTIWTQFCATCSMWPAWGGRLDRVNSRGAFENQPFFGSVILWTRTLLIWSKMLKGRVVMFSAETYYFTQWWWCWPSYTSVWLYWGSPRSSGKLRLWCSAS